MGPSSREASSIITADTRFSPSRRPPQPRTSAERQHIRHIGEIVHAWNHAHGVLFHVFSVVVADDNISLAHALWHSIQSDKGQRAMLSAVVRDKYPKSENSIRAAILWAVAALDQLGTHRNDAAHVDIIAGHPEIIPGMSTKAASSERLEKSPVSKHAHNERRSLRHYELPRRGLFGPLEWVASAIISKTEIAICSASDSEITGSTSSSQKSTFQAPAAII